MPKSTPKTHKKKRTTKHIKKTSSSASIAKNSKQVKKPDVSLTAFTSLINDPTKPLVLAGKLPDIGIRIIKTTAAKTESVIEFAATALLTALSLSIANRFRIQPHSDNKSYRITPNLSGMIIADPGSRKSAPVQATTKPLKNLEKRQAKKLIDSAQKTAKELAIQELNNTAHKKKAKQFHSELMEQEPGSDEYNELNFKLHNALDKVKDDIKRARPKIFILQEPTQKGLIQIAEVQSEPVLIYKDELAPFLEEVYASRNGGFRRYLIEAMDGKNEYTNVTANKATVTVQPPVISLLGTTQPSVINKLIDKIMAEKVADDGYIDRFQLLSCPCPRYVIEHSSSNKHVDEEALKSLNKIIKQLYSKSSKKVIITLDEGAFEGFESFKTKISVLQKSGAVSTNVRNKLSKYPDMMLSIALVIAVLREYEEKQSISTLKTLTSTDIKMAQKWAHHYFQHTKKLWGSKSPNMESALKILENMDKLIEKDGCFTTRSITQKNWTGINNDSEKARKALNKLVEKGVIEPVDSKNKTGRPTEKWRLIANIVD